MGYVAIKGGGKSIKGASELIDFIRARQGQKANPLGLDDIEHQLHLLHSKVISEGGLYHPKLAALAVKQSLGDSLEASFCLRAYRSTQERLAETPMLSTAPMRLIRRVSAAFKDIPGGQMLGATSDFAWRLLKMELADESPEAFGSIAEQWLADLPGQELPDTFDKVVDRLRADGMLPPKSGAPTQRPVDITREPLTFPIERSATLATLSRGETGGLLALAYSNMRGYGDVHPTVAELRVGYLPVYLPHPVTGDLVEAGEVLVTECELVAMYESTEKDAPPRFTLGYGACLGHNEVKAIAMAVLDRSIQKGAQSGPSNPSEDAEFVLLHVDGVDSMGFCTHYKMPHYVTFQSDMDRLRKTQQTADTEGNS